MVPFLLLHAVDGCRSTSATVDPELRATDQESLICMATSLYTLDHSQSIPAPDLPALLELLAVDHQK